MTPEQLNEARAVAGKLTPKQREVITECGADWTRAVNFSGKCATRLGWSMRFPTLIASYGYGTNDKRYCLTPLGLAVKSILQEHPNG